MKRSKEVSRRRPADRGEVSRKSSTERVHNWDEEVASLPTGTFSAYAASHRFAKNARVMHPVFGPGLVLKVEGTKLEILFKDGMKKLVHNPAGTEPPAPEAT